MNRHQPTSSINEVFDQVSEGIFLKGSDGRYQYVNLAAAHILDASPAQILGKDDAAFYSQETSQYLRKIELSTTRLGLPATFQVSREVDGLLRHFVFSIQPYQQNGADANGILGIIRPVPDRPQNNLPPAIQDLFKAPPLLTKAPANETTQDRQGEETVLQINRALLSVQSAAAAIASSLNLQHVLDTFSWELINLLDAHYCVVYGWYAENGLAIQIASYETHDRNLKTHFTLQERPVLHQVIKEQRTLQYLNQGHDLGTKEVAYMAGRNLSSLLLLPMVFQDRVLGFVEIGRRNSGHDFTEQESSLSQLLANQAAAAFSNARLYEELERRLHELSSLNQIGQAVTATLDLKKTLTLITNHTVNLLEVASASVALVDEVQAEFWFAASSGEAAELFREKRFKIGEGIIGQAIAHGETQLVLDVAQHPHHLPEMDIESGFQTRSLLCVPLRVHDQIVGAIQAINPASETFTQDNARLLKSLAVPAATAIYNARLYQQARQEVMERSLAEKKIQSSLEEKEVLLKEIHHRVKNNLQVISSLINLQSEIVEDPRILAIFQDSQDRIRSMALIHEKLYRSQNLAHIDVAEYISDLSRYLAQSHSTRGRSILMEVEAENVYLDVNTAVPCGLLLNELISNAFKHAFRDHQSGRITIRARLINERDLQLQVEDNGTGIPDSLDFRQTSSLGLQLVNSLAVQLDGSITLERNQGTTFTIVFPINYN